LLIGVKTAAQYSGTGTFTKVSAAADLTDGYYVIAYGTTFAMNNTYTSSTYFANTSISPASGTTLTNPSKSIVWKIETNGSGKTIYNEETAVYASYTGSSNNVQAVTSVSGNNQRWNITYVSGSLFGVQNLGVTSRYLQYNTSSPRFACYTGTQQDITFYKMASASYTVTFNGNGSTGGSMASQSAGSSTALTANGFTKTGYGLEDGHRLLLMLHLERWLMPIRLHILSQVAQHYMQYGILQLIIIVTEVQVLLHHKRVIIMEAPVQVRLH
jgi:hypothetical protein